MCILCVVQRWSRRVATMLPWLVIPLIILWALSQLLPPGFRFEVTSPRLACVLVLLVTLFWYEILMPQLSIWRARRSARLREHHRTQAIELQKLRKSATRRCRNCNTPYRDQNPGGGRFMCSYCGHISKRPVLDLPGSTGSPGIIGDLVRKNTWICSQDWSVEGNGNWVCPVPRYWGDDQCLTEKSYSGAVVFACKLLSCFFLSVRWLWRKGFRVGSSAEDGSSDGDQKGLSGRKGDNGGNFQESRGEKARRKAEERRQAKLEKEMLEEEERKQREEVARLVEERRKLRDEKLGAEKEQLKVSAADGERDVKKETERRRRERRKEKDKASSKSNSDGEELEKRMSREIERKRDFDKKGEHERRELQKTLVENYKSHISEGGYGSKVVASKSRYLDRVKGTFLSSSRGFNGGSFFGRNAQSPAAVAKANKPATGYIDHGQNSGNKRDPHYAGHVVGKSTSNGDERVPETDFHRPVGSDVPPQTTVLKKSWHQLFTRSSAVSPEPDMNTTSFTNQNGELEAHSVQLTDQMLPNYSLDEQINFGTSLPISAYPSANGSFYGKSVSSVMTDSMYPLIKEPGPNPISEDPELFEDPCYVPDPTLLLGPVSESLDNFPLDLGTGFIENNKMEGPRVLKTASPLAEVNKPSPIESPMSKLRVAEERQVSSTPKSKELANLGDSSISHGQGMWQMWGTPMAQDGLGLVVGQPSWFSPLAPKKSNQENVMHPLSHNPIISQIAKESHTLPSIRTHPNVSAGNRHNSGTFGPLGPGLSAGDLWAQNSSFQPPLPVDGESHFLPLNLIENIAPNEVTYGSPNRPAPVNPYELSQANSWPNREELALHGIQEAGSSTPVRPPHIGGLFSTSPEVQSVWSFNHQ